MGKKCLTLALALLFPLAGCGNMFEEEYHYAAPFTYTVDAESGDAVEISNYNMLKTALMDLIGRHGEDAVFRFNNYHGSVSDDLASACLEIRTTNPVGAYAVEALSYDTSRIVSYYVADVSVSYRRSAEELERVVWISTLQELDDLVRNTISDYGREMVLRVYMPQVDEAYIAGRAEEIYLSDPVTVVTEPVVEITSYPSEGSNRIYDVRLKYGPNTQKLRTMSRRLTEQISEMTADIPVEDAPQMALNLAETLFSRMNGSAEKGSTAYAAIVSRSADSKGIALAYKAICNALNMECLTVRGQQFGDAGAEEHWWNIILLDGDYYHVDVSRFGEGRAEAFLIDDAGRWGEYLWDTADYPECAGPLRYTDLVPEPVPNENLIGPIKLPNPDDAPEVQEDQVIPSEPPQPEDDQDLAEASPEPAPPAETPPVPLSPSEPPRNGDAEDASDGEDAQIKIEK